MEICAWNGYEISSGISTKPEQYGNGTPFLSFSAIFNNYFIPDELKELMNTTEKEQELYSIKKSCYYDIWFNFIF